MSGKYKFHDQNQIYFESFATLKINSNNKLGVLIKQLKTEYKNGSSHRLEPVVKEYAYLYSENIFKIVI